MTSARKKASPQQLQLDSEIRLPSSGLNVEGTTSNNKTR